MSSIYDVSIILACYNEEPVFESSIKQIFETMDNTRWTYEVIFVDDCSVDRTRSMIDQIIIENPTRNLQKIYHEKNAGRGKTVSDGFFASRGKYIGFLDVDLEVGAHYIPRMIFALQNGADVATAYRIYQTTLRLLIRSVLSHGYRILVRSILKLPLVDTETGFKFFNREKILPVLSQTKDPGWFWDTEIMARAYIANLNIVELPCLFIRRYDKKSSVRLWRDTFQYFKKIIQFSRENKKENI